MAILGHPVYCVANKLRFFVLTGWPYTHQLTEILISVAYMCCFPIVNKYQCLQYSRIRAPNFVEVIVFGALHLFPFELFISKSTTRARRCSPLIIGGPNFPGSYFATGIMN